MNLLSLIGEVVGPVGKLIDDLHTSEDEKLSAKNQLMAIQASVVSQAIEYETKMITAKRDIIVAEAKSDSWPTRNWRPLVMVGLMGCVMAFWFGLTPDNERITEEVVLTMFNLVKIGIGGYIASRGIEKVAPGIVGAFKKKERT